MEANKIGVYKKREEDRPEKNTERRGKLNVEQHKQRLEAVRPPAVSYRITDGADSLPSIYTATFEHIFVVKTTFRHIALIRFAMMCTLQRSSKYTVLCCVCAKCVSYKGGERDW